LQIDAGLLPPESPPVDRYFAERNREFRQHPKRAGGKIWGDEIVAPKFSVANNCKNPRYMNAR